ncbi:MAG: hypothetical protein AAB731_00675 [Patescibacteria group bacterium]
MFKKINEAIFSVKAPLLLFVGALVVFNQFLIYDLNKNLGGTRFWANWNLSAFGRPAMAAEFKVMGGKDAIERAMNSIMMKGMPAMYGSELQVNFDNAEASMNALAALDASIPFSALSKEAQERYLDIGGRIACEFCCGVKTLIFDNGEAACGCAHSQAMRGLAKYLLQKYPSEYTNETLLFELTKWKALFFPQNMVERAAALINSDLPLNPNNLNTNNPSAKPVESSGKTSLPSMVGGC